MTFVYRVATDVGGTFTDLIYYKLDRTTGRLEAMQCTKTDTTPPNFEKGVMDALEKSGLTMSDITFFAHGSTVVINALTERKGVKTGLITTQGFRDVLEIARGNRPDFFNLLYKKPPPFVPRYLRREVKERMTYDGHVHSAIDLTTIKPILDDFQKDGVEAIAICLLHSYANPSHEIAIYDEVKKYWPDVAVVASHQITREWREYERSNTTVLSAYVQPLTERYLDALDQKLRQNGLQRSPFIMQSNGGIDTVGSAKSKPVSLVESGPASGVRAAAELGQLLGIPNIIAFDIGGTTAKCSLIDNGEVRVTTQYMIEKNAKSAGYPIMASVVDIVEIGNGGGSIAWVDDYGKLHVGPESAGAVPGPAAYGRGGSKPTTTDANLVTGRIDPNYFMGGQRKADMDAVHNAFQPIADHLHLSVEETARGVIRIANHNMINALKLVSVNRGYDPRHFTMIAFGGGGAMHATTLARELNIPKVIIPINASVFSAFGMLMSDLRRDYVMTKLTPLGPNSAAIIRQVFDDMEHHAKAEYKAEDFNPGNIVFTRHANIRYIGQEHSVAVKVTGDQLTDQNVQSIIDSFHDNFEREYTYRLPNDVEIVSYQITATIHIPKPDIPKLPRQNQSIEGAIKGWRPVDFDVDGTHQATIYDTARLGPDMHIQGPAIVEDPGTTIVILPGQTATVDDYGNLHIVVEGAHHG